MMRGWGQKFSKDHSLYGCSRKTVSPTQGTAKDKSTNNLRHYIKNWTVFRYDIKLDRIFDFTLFNSIKDVQTLIGLIVTVILKRQFELKAGFIDHKKLSDIVKTEETIGH